MKPFLTVAMTLACATLAVAQPAPRVGNTTQTKRTTFIRLVLGAVGPGAKVVGQQATYTLTLQNTGDTAAQQVVFTHELPAGFRFLSADGGRFDSAKHRVTWTWNELPPGTKKELRLNVEAVNPGDWKHKLEAHEQRGTRVQTEFITRIESAEAYKPMEVIEPLP